LGFSDGCFSGWQGLKPRPRGAQRPLPLWVTVDNTPQGTEPEKRHFTLELQLDTTQSRPLACWSL
jgi:hypothetical protein